MEASGRTRRSKCGSDEGVRKRGKQVWKQQKRAWWVEACLEAEGASGSDGNNCEAMVASGRERKQGS